MIAHVAAAGEGRGRVVLELGMAAPLADVAIEAAIRVAQAFQSEIESLIVEEQQLVDFAGHAFAREVSLSGRAVREVKPGDIERDMRLHLAAMQRRVVQAARAADIQIHSRVVREDPVDALARACAERGPWNVVTLGATFDDRQSGRLAALFTFVEGTTGFVLAGPEARRTHGNVVAVIEDIERVPPMLRAAERLATASGGEAQLWLVDQDRERLEWMDGQVRLVLEPNSDVHIECVIMDRASPDTILNKLKQAVPGFVIARFGGGFAPHDGDLTPLVGKLECPLLLVR